MKQARNVSDRPLIPVVVLLAFLFSAGNSAAQPSLTGVAWEWYRQSSEVSGTTDVPNPENYLVTFNTDGTINGTADCNSFSGTYTENVLGMEIVLGSMTLAACGPESMDSQFLEALAATDSSTLEDNGELTLVNAADTERMHFRDPSGAAAGSTAAAQGSRGFLGLPWWLWLLLGLLLLGLLWWLFSRGSKPEPEPEAKAAPPPPVDRTAPPPPVAAAAAPVEKAAPIFEPDDLTRIEGIGPVIAQVLNDADIHTFAVLAGTSVASLRTILATAKLSADPATWPEQAALAAAGRWDDLEAMQARLKGGRA